MRKGKEERNTCPSPSHFAGKKGKKSTKREINQSGRGKKRKSTAPL